MEFDQWQVVKSHPSCNFCQNSINMWTYIDAAYIICLATRDDRYQRALEEVHRTGLCQIATFFRAIKSEEGFVAGCWDSHVQVAKRAMEKQQKFVMALEDDFQFDLSRAPESISTQISQAIDKLPQNKWTRLSLGHISWFKMFYARGVDRSASVLTHAQVWSVDGLKWMATHPYNEEARVLGVQVDGFISYKLAFAYAITPMVAFQRNESSDRLANDPWLEQSNMEATEIWIPIVWGISVICGLISLLCILKYVVHLTWTLSLVLASCIILVPFGLVWGIILLDGF